MDDDDTTQQFDGVVQSAGFRIAPERRKTMLSAYLQVVVWSEIVHDHHLFAQMEPSNVFAPQCDEVERETGA